MATGWRTILRTIAVTFLVTTVFWLGLAIWWFSATVTPVSGQMPTDDPARHERERSGSQPSSNRPAPPAAMRIPVAGVVFADLTDTFSDVREGGARRHDALDIMAERGTSVVAAAPGRIEKLFFSEAGGKSAYIRSSDGRLIFYYAHLDAYAPGLRESASVNAGDPIGTVGSTGNASDEAPHLHFAVWETEPSKKWWEPSRPVNPYPMFAPRPDRRHLMR
jgi:murein DD-endopeptidase MepM/ murein hydrolase activator NlpD